jgi:signal transduction histidine kinase
VTRVGGVGVTVRGMRVHALLDSAKRRCARGGAGLVDMVVALLLLAVALALLAGVPRDDSPVVAVASCVVMAGAVALRRRMPTLTVLAALTGLVGYVLTTHDPNLASPPVAVLLTFYSLGRSAATPHRRVLVLVGLAGLGLGATWAVSAELKQSVGSAVSSWLVAVMAPLAVGVLLARRRLLSRRLADAADQLRAEQDLNAAQATAEERNRVARDLHDVVAHCVSVMVVQAGAARLVAAKSPADADRALAVIGGCGRDAMADLRRIVGVLRRADDPAFGRGAGLGDLGLLTERIRAAGVPTEVHLLGGTNLPAAVDLVAYRVAQEALTNVVKHAGEGATATLDVRVGPEAVTVEVTNTTAAAARPPFAPSGHGLLGMKERVAAYGGDLRVGPGPDGGYQVRAQIPFHPVAPAEVGAAASSRRRALRPSQWMSTGVASAMIVAFWLVVMEIEVAASSARQGPWLLNAAAVGAMALAAGWRRRYPLLFLAVVGGLAVVLSGGLTSVDRSTFAGLYTLAVPLFTVAAWEPRTRATVGLALWAAGSSAAAVVHNASGGLAGAWVVAIVVWAAGRVWRAQLLLNAELTETMERLAAERDQRSQLAVATERTRIARDLHGPVAHGVITMVVQAEAARTLLVHQPAEAEAVIRDIEQTGRDALSQLRRILGVLRSSAGTSTPTAIGARERPPVSHLGVDTARKPEEVLT